MLRRRAIQLACVGCATISLLGCDTLTGVRSSNGGDDVPLARALDRQILEMDVLSSAPYQERIDAFRRIELDYVDNPSDSNRLRLALAKGMEGHPASDLEGALTNLQELLAGPNTLSPTQLRLARMSAREIESNIVTSSQLRELRARVSDYERSSSDQSSQAGRRLQSTRNRLRELEAQNTRLQEELEQARRQLDAIMSIETSSDPEPGQ